MYVDGYVIRNLDGTCGGNGISGTARVCEAEGACKGILCCRGFSLAKNVGGCSERQGVCSVALCLRYL